MRAISKSPPTSRRRSPEPHRTDALGRTVAALHPAFELPLGRADPSCSRVEGLQPLQVLHSPPTRELTFTILAFDAMHAPLHTGGDAFSVAIRGPAPVWPSLTDNGDGSYACEWHAKVSGEYSVAVTLRGGHVWGSPFAVRLAPTGADPELTRLTLPRGEIVVVAGEPGRFGVEVCDGVGNTATLEPLELRCALWHTSLSAVRAGASRSPSSPRSPRASSTSAAALSSPRGEAVPITLVGPERSGGTAGATFTMTKAGLFDMHVSLRRQPVAGSPFCVRVLPAGAWAAASHLEPASGPPARAMAGQRRSLRVVTHDRWANRCARGGAALRVEASHGIHAEADDLGDGTFRVSWFGSAKGSHTLQVSIDGRPVRGSPLIVQVDPAAVRPSRCEASGDLHEIVAGGVALVALRCYDAFGNAAPPSASTSFGVSLHPPEHGAGVPAVGGATALPKQALPLSARWTRDGMYELSYSCSVAGTFALRLHCCAEGATLPLPGPYSLVVRPAPPHAAGSTLRAVDGGRGGWLEQSAEIGEIGDADEIGASSHRGGGGGGGGGVMVAGSPLELGVSLADRFGNVCGRGAAHLELCLDGPEGTLYLDCAPRWSGSTEAILEARHVPTIAGKWRLSALLDGLHLRGSPRTFAVVAAAADGSASTLVPPLVAPRAHETFSFVVEPRDRFGNACAASGSSGSGKGSSGLGATVVARLCGPSRPDCTQAELSSGAVQLLVTASLSGEYRLHVTVGGTPLATGPFPLRVQPNGFAPSASSASAVRSPGASTTAAWAASRASPRSPRSPPRSPRSPPPRSPPPRMPAAAASAPPPSQRSSVTSPRSGGSGLASANGNGRAASSGRLSSPRSGGLGSPRAAKATSPRATPSCTSVRGTARSPTASPLSSPASRTSLRS